MTLSVPETPTKLVVPQEISSLRTISGVTAARAAFSAATGDVNMLVNEARRQDFVGSVNCFQFGQNNRQIFTDCGNLVVNYQNILNSQIIRL